MIIVLLQSNRIADRRGVLHYVGFCLFTRLCESAGVGRHPLFDAAREVGDRQSRGQRQQSGECRF